MKPFTQYKVEELVKLLQELELEVPEKPYYKKDLLFILDEQGLTPSGVAKFKEKQDKESGAVEIDDAMSVVCMDRTNSLYQVDKYKFSKDNKYILMPTEDANKILKEHSGFHKASREEIKAYFS